MPASALALSKLLGALGYKQQETFPTIEAVQPVAIVGDWSSLVPNPHATKAVWGGWESVPAFFCFGFEITSGGGAMVKVMNLTTDVGVGVVPVEIRVAPIGDANNVPKTKTLIPVDTSVPGSPAITTVGYQGVTPIAGAPREDRPCFGVHQLGKTQGFSLYVAAGNVIEFLADSDLMLATEIVELPEVHPAR